MRAGRDLTVALAGAVVGLLAFGVPLAMLERAKRAPPIHDISTDTADPPPLVPVVPLRDGAPNSIEYAGESVAAQQHAAYPDIRPLWYGIRPSERTGARDAARRMGWAIDASVPADGRIEATDTTPWFGFKDDIVVRITPTASGSRVDVRSKSRVGRGDAGTNARRIRGFRERLS